MVGQQAMGDQQATGGQQAMGAHRPMGGRRAHSWGVEGTGGRGMAVWRIVRWGSARRAVTRVVVAVAVTAVAAVGLATTAAAQDGFTDVTSRSHKANIEALAEMGLFDGTECGERKFCQDDPALRWTVAVWIVRALDGVDPPAVSQSRFADVDSDQWWMPYVERLADLGITVGCKRDPRRFCPDETVTRARMASFLVRAFDLAEAPSAGFADTAGSSHETNIDALFAAGITVGCKQDPLRYCPNNPVSRAQMATLLRRGLDTRPEPASLTIGAGPRSGDTLLVATRGHACTVRLDSTVACWGDEEGLLEHMSASGLNNVVALSTGQDPVGGLHSCVVHNDGTVSCWGPGHEGQLGQGTTETHQLPVAVPGITGAVAVAVGSAFTCVAHRDGGVSCWGRSWYGQLGVRVEQPNRSTPQRIPGLTDMVAISAGQDHSCAVHRAGDVSCWGWVYGETPSRITGVGPVSSVSSGGTQTCVTTVDGHLYCWDRDTTTVQQMSRVDGISDAVEASVGDGTVCVLHRDGGVSCWGENTVGEVGDGTTTSRSQPVRLDAVTDAVDVSVSSGAPDVGPHACALDKGGSVWCWGGNELGQLGDGTGDNGLTPRRIKQLKRIPAGEIPTTSTELLVDWTDAVVQNREADSPWLRVAWDHVRDQAEFGQSGFAGFISTYCYADAAANDAFGCGVRGLVMTEISLSVIHELAHVYDLHTGLAPSSAWGAVQLYFATTHPGCFAGADFHGVEILADTVLHVMASHAWLTYYESSGCPTLPEGSKPTLEAQQVVRQGLAGGVPDWYRENITNGAELWAAWLRAPSLLVLANLAGEFGGLCSTDWITHPFDPARFPPAGSNPFKDGGCGRNS